MTIVAILLPLLFELYVLRCFVFCFFWGDDPDCNKLSLNQYMVRSGNAVAYKRYSKKYLNDEEWAKKNKLGIWGGEFENPEEWRKNN